MLRQKSPIVNHQFSACFTIFEWPQWPSFWAKSPMISERNSAGLTHQSFGQLAVSTSGPGCTFYINQKTSALYLIIPSPQISTYINIYQPWCGGYFNHLGTIGLLDDSTVGPLGPPCPPPPHAMRVLARPDRCPVRRRGPSGAGIPPRTDHKVRPPFFIAQLTHITW